MTAVTADTEKLWCRESSAGSSLGRQCALVGLAISTFPCLHLLISPKTAANIEK